MTTTSIVDFFAIFTSYLLDFLVFFIFLRVILSWFPIPPGRFTTFLRNMTNPIFRYFSKLPFSRIGFFDLTPIWAYFGLQVLAWLLAQFFLRLGANPAIYGM